MLAEKDDKDYCGVFTQVSLCDYSGKMLNSSNGVWTIAEFLLK